MKKLVIGILAHVDAGKTTLSEAILYESGSIRKLGRVDDRNAFLDTYRLERERGITIFSKQAKVTLEKTEITLLDTPGHVDFSAEMERTLQVLDYAILVISGADGVQGHTETLWKLLKRYQIPTFLFINKLDQRGIEKAVLMQELKQRFDNACVEFDETKEFLENVAMCDEALLESYLEDGTMEKTEIVELIAQRKIYPCYFGSALKLIGVKAFLKGIETYTRQSSYSKEFGAKVFKIARDEQDNRLTYLKITGGSLKVRMSVMEEKISQIRIYSGAKYEAVNEVTAGDICAVTGLTKTYSGQSLGSNQSFDEPVLEPVLTYRMELPKGCDVQKTLKCLKMLEEEEPQLHIVWNEQAGEIQAQLMGEVQTEILKSLIKERFDIDVAFGVGKILYKETIKNTVEGVGHYEPLRHYAEVHLLLEPLKQGSGLVFDSIVNEDVLECNWQRLVLTHLKEKIHYGVLIGAPITDMKITLVAGKAHLKHTEGGDFRQATYRAVRQGLMQAESVLLEPYYEFRLEIPTEFVGKAMTDIEQMYGKFELSQSEGITAVLEGSAPVAIMRNYQVEVMSYSKGQGRLSCRLKGYAPCHNSIKVVEESDYQAELDADNPSHSIFCSHGAGFAVSWDCVKDYMHLPFYEAQKIKQCLSEENVATRTVQKCNLKEEKELEEIFLRTYGVSKREKQAEGGNIKVKRNEYIPKKKEEQIEEYLLIDGYNIVFAWKELKELAEINIDSARNRLADILCNYQGFKQCHLILVFDAYKVQNYTGEAIKYHNIHIVYTKQAESADEYIGKLACKIGVKNHVTVATSDNAIQLIIMGQGCVRMSALELKEEIEEVNRQIQKEYLEQSQSKKQYLFDHVHKRTKEQLEAVRLGYKNFGEK